MTSNHVVPGSWSASRANRRSGAHRSCRPARSTWAVGLVVSVGSRRERRGVHARRAPRTSGAAASPVAGHGGRALVTDQRPRPLPARRDRGGHSRDRHNCCGLAAASPSTPGCAANVSGSPPSTATQPLERVILREDAKATLQFGIAHERAVLEWFEQLPPETRGRQLWDSSSDVEFVEPAQ